MVGCSIRNCKSRSVKGGTIRFFSFPSKHTLADEWLRYCGSNTTKKNGRVCSKHFLDSDYNKPLPVVLLNNSARCIRLLNPDAIPTLHIDSTDKQNTLNMSVEEISRNYGLAYRQKPLIKREEVEKISKPVNEVAGSSKVVNKSDKTISVSVAESKRSIILLKPDAISMLQIDSIDKQNTLNLSVEEISRNCLAYGQKPLIKREAVEEISKPANEVAASSKVVNKSDKIISVSLAEYKSLNRTAKKFEALKTNLEKVFTPGQIRCLMAPDKRRVKWSAEDIARAITLRRISQKAYHHLRVTVGIPLPALSTLRKWIAASNSEIAEGLLENVVLLDEIQSQELELTGETCL